MTVKSLECIGPFGDGSFLLTIDGLRVPYLKAWDKGGGRWSIVLDEYYAIDTNEEEIERWVRFLADAMARVAGWTCFGEDKKQVDLFNIKLIGISLDEIQAISPACDNAPKEH